MTKTLGWLITQFERLKKKQKRVNKQYGREAVVKFDFGSATPISIDSWRGVYAELALGYNINTEAPTVSEFLVLLKSALKSPFTGYKGGTYVYALDTQVWVDNYGECTHTAITGIKDLDNFIIITTQNID